MLNRALVLVAGMLHAACLVAAALPAMASNLKPEQVPTFSVRSRVLKVAGEAPAGKPFTLRYDVPSEQVNFTGGDWSAWLPYGAAQAEATIKGYPAQYIPLWPVVVRLQFGGLADPALVEAELKLDESGETIPFDGELMGGSLGLLVWRDEQNKPHASGMTAYNRRYWQAIGLDPQAAPLRPKQFPIVDRFIGGDDDRRGWREGITELNRAGFSGIMLPPDKRLRELLLATGQRRTAWAVYNPPGYAFDHEGITDEAIAKWAKEQADPYKAAGYEPRDMSLFAMSDEPGWYYPQAFKGLVANPEALDRFRKYIAAQRLQPADVGHNTWETVLPIGRSSAKDLPSKRLFYWTMRFFPWDSARHFAKSTKALEAEFYPGMPIFTNWNFFSGRCYVPGPVANNPDKQSADAGMGGHDWFEFARLRGGTMLWTEDWFPDSQAYQWSFYMAKLRSAARLGNVEYGGYVIPRTAGDREHGIEQKILSVVGHGGKAVKYFVFGPEYVFPGNCYSENAKVMRCMAKAHAMIAKAEDLLWPGRPVPAQVAILAPRSACIWDDNGAIGATPIQDATNNHLTRDTVDYMAEVFGLYLALQHANIPCDFVDEDGLTAEGLKPFKVLYVTEPNVPKEGQEALVQWVKAGGNLVLVPGAATSDRYGEPCQLVQSASGYEEKSLKRVLVSSLDSLPRVDLLDIGGTYRRLGEGQVLHFHAHPGLAYLGSATAQIDGMSAGYSAAFRQAIAGTAEHASDARPIAYGKTPEVEILLLKSEAGYAATLLNWTGEAIGSFQFELVLELGFDCQAVESVLDAPVGASQDEAGVWNINLPLNATDIVLFRRQK